MIARPCRVILRRRICTRARFAVVARNGRSCPPGSPPTRAIAAREWRRRAITHCRSSSCSAPKVFRASFQGTARAVAARLICALRIDERTPRRNRRFAHSGCFKRSQPATLAALAARGLQWFCMRHDWGGFHPTPRIADRPLHQEPGSAQRKSAASTASGSRTGLTRLASPIGFLSLVPEVTWGQPTTAKRVDASPQPCIVFGLCQRSLDFNGRDHVAQERRQV